MHAHERARTFHNTFQVYEEHIKLYLEYQYCIVIGLEQYSAKFMLWITIPVKFSEHI